MSRVVPGGPPRPPRGRRGRGVVFGMLMVNTELRTSNFELRTLTSRAKPPKARYMGGTSQVIGRGLGDASQVHARYMHGTSQGQAASKPTESQDRAYGRRGNQPLAPSSLSLPLSAFALSFHAGCDEDSGRHCELSYPGCWRFFPSISTNEKAG